MSDFGIPDSAVPSRRARRAADAVLRADVRRRDRIDRYARSAITPPPGGMIGRVLAVVRSHAPA